MTIKNLIVYNNGWAVWGEERFSCSIGRSGVTLAKKEGDGATPEGVFPLRLIYYRCDRMPFFKTHLPQKIITPLSGWSDDPKDPQYNQYIRLPHAFHYEELWREEAIYDVIVALGYNDDPPISGKGSAIFMHVARPSYEPTQGCIALRKEHLLHVLKQARRGCAAHVKNLALLPSS